MLWKTQSNDRWQAARKSKRSFLELVLIFVYVLHKSQKALPVFGLLTFAKKKIKIIVLVLVEIHGRILRCKHKLIVAFGRSS